MPAPSATLASVASTLDSLTKPPETLGDDPRSGTLTELAFRLKELNWIIMISKNLIEEITQAAAGEMTAAEMNIPGVAYLTLENKTSTSWVDDTSRDKMFEDGISAIVGIVAVDRGTGEIHDHIAKASREVWRLTLESFSIGADPKTAFKKVLGLDPRDYRNKDTAGYKIKIQEPRI